ncbi:hypothetical protein [Mesorhizobium sp. ANAO-SY3R2]|uniref:hypothetical protein n=1 Tax=Mesorhizobium sp. ANAO-SY3R2 TaxID=3166644 RepID=UPI00366F0089
MAEDVTVSIRADTAPFQTALQSLERLSDNFGAQLTGAMKSAVVSGRELDDILRRIGLNLAGMALQQGLKPLPVRFDVERLSLSLTAFKAGQIPSIPLVEVGL